MKSTCKSTDGVDPSLLLYKSHASALSHCARVEVSATLLWLDSPSPFMCARLNYGSLERLRTQNFPPPLLLHLLFQTHLSRMEKNILMMWIERHYIVFTKALMHAHILTNTWKAFIGGCFRDELFSKGCFSSAVELSVVPDDLKSRRVSSSVFGEL